MDDKQRKVKVGNLVAELRRANKIANKGSDTRPAWSLVKAANL
jgi:ATP-dependent DNA helicase RecG